MQLKNRKNVTIIIATVASTCAAAYAEQVLQPPLVLNCGPRTDEDSLALAEARERRAIRPDRLLYLPDVPFRESTGYGHRGGEGYWHWHGGCRPALGPHWETDLFSSGRAAPRSYLFALPQGDYRVTIGICDGDVHVEGQRVFDVVVNGHVIAHDVDSIADAGYKEPMMLATRAKVVDGVPLSISFPRKSERSPIVSAIWITPDSPRGRQTTKEDPDRIAPTAVRAVGSYGANLIFWHRPKGFGIDGFLVRRRAQDEDEFTLVNDDPISIHRWIDRDVQPGKSYRYQVGSVDLDGAQHWSESSVTATPRAIEESSLPYYSIRLPAESRRQMLLNVHENHTVDGTFSFEGKTYPIEMRLRGASTRYAAKKSYRIRFPDDCPFTRKVTYLKAEPMDHTMQQEKLTCDLFRAAGSLISQTEYINLFINDQYEGAYLDMEPVRSPFKKRPGLDPKGTLIRASTFQHMRGWDELGELRGNVGSLSELKEFIRRINGTPRGKFEQFVREHTDWPRVRDYLALVVLCHRSEIEADDYFYYRAPASGRWSFIGWDHNNGNFNVQAYGNRVGESYIHVFPQTIQQLSWRPDYWYVLPSRIFQEPTLRKEYLDRLEELTELLLASGRFATMVDDNFRQLRSEYPLDPYRWPYTGSDPFDRSANDLKRFARQHARQILRQIQGIRNRRPPTVVINEFSFGQKSGWIELFNQGNRAQSLRRLQLVTKDNAGNWSLPLTSQPDLHPNEYRVISIPRKPIEVPRFDDAEARERWEIEMRRRDRQDHFPGFSPAGGFVALVSSQPSEYAADGPADDDDRERETILDFYFYGPQQPGKSYGRIGSAFGHQVPTPRLRNRP